MRYEVSWWFDTEDAATPIEAAQQAWAAMRALGSIATVFTVRDEAGEVVTVDLCDREPDLTDRAPEALKRAAVLVPLLTVGQVFAAGTDAIEAAGLDPWCMNEGLADKDSTLGRQWWLKEE